MNSRTKNMVLCGIFAAIICICSVISLPIGVIPITLGTFGIMLTGNVLGIKNGFIAVIIYILLGTIGLPVFAGFQGGIGVIAAPTGGFIIGYLLMVSVTGIKHRRVITGVLLNIGGLVLCYICGVIHYVYITGLDIKTAVFTCVVPFVVFDIIKAVGAVLTGQSIKKVG